MNTMWRAYSTKPTRKPSHNMIKGNVINDGHLIISIVSMRVHDGLALFILRYLNFTPLEGGDQPTLSSTNHTVRET